MRLRRPLAVAAAAVCAVVCSAAPAQAAASGHIEGLESKDGVLTVVFSGSDLPQGTKIDPQTVRVVVGSRSIPATAAPVPTQGDSAVLRTAVLVIDTSGSMQGAGITGAKAAAKSYVTSVPDDVRVGVVSFSQAPTVRIRPTADKKTVIAAIDGLTASGETALYAGVQAGLRELGSTGVRSMLLLSDGADTSKTSPTAVLAAARASGAKISAVAFKNKDSVGPDLKVLSQIASSGGGGVIPATQADDIARIFKAVALDLSNQLKISVPIPKDLAGKSLDVEVTAQAGETLLSDHAFTLLGSAFDKVSKGTAQGPQPANVSVGPLASRTALYVAIGAVFAGLLLLFLIVFLAMSRDRKDVRVQRRLSIYTLTGRKAQEAQRETTVLGDNAVARTAVEFAGRAMRQRDMETGLARRLDAGGIPLKPAEFLLIHVGIAIALPLIMLLLSGGSVAAALIGLLIGIIVPFGYLSFKESRRTSAFLNQLPDTLQLLAGSLSAGYSFPQAVDAVVQQGSQPIAGEFNKALVESRLGFPVEDAMEGIATRMKSKDFAWVIMAVRIQREVGGNLAEVLTTVAATLRERERIRRQVLTLSAEGKLSAAILFALPVLFSIYLLLVRGEYIRVLYTDPIGIFLLIVMAVQLTVGAFWMRKVVKVEV